MRRIILLSVIMSMAIALSCSAARIRTIDAASLSTSDSLKVSTQSVEIGDGYFDSTKGIEFAKWVRERIVYNGDAHGRMTVKFSVKEDGTVFNVKIVKSIDPELDKITKKVVASSPKWKQTTSDLITTTFATYTIPLNF